MKLEKIVTSSPHIKQADSTRLVMLDVIIALVPAGIAAVFFFGISAMLIIATSVVSSVLAEYVWCKLMKKPISTGDLSAVITGLLLAYSLPPSTPLWIVIIGACFSIIVVKQLFGGLGHNFMNPALCGRAFMLASWPSYMTEWTAPSLFGADAISAATPLAALRPICPIRWAHLSSVQRCPLSPLCTMATICIPLFGTSAKSARFRSTQ